MIIATVTHINAAAAAVAFPLWGATAVGLLLALARKVNRNTTQGETR